VVVNDREILQKMSEIHQNVKMAFDTPISIMVRDDPELAIAVLL
jgi:hypothetical protein